MTPYLAYMRQDIAFHPGEAISQRIIGALLAQTFDAVITVDAHLHRIDHLSQAMPVKNNKKTMTLWEWPAPTFSQHHRGQQEPTHLPYAPPFPS